MARIIAGAPGRRQAQALLEEIAAGCCRFAPVAADKPLALYGAGSLGRLARDVLRTAGHDFVMALDRNAPQLASSTDWTDVLLLHPDDVAPGGKRGVRVAVSIVTAPYVPIERSLAELGFDDIVPFYDLAESLRHKHPLSNGWFAASLSAEDREQTARVLGLWHDDVSRAHHLHFLAWRRLREEWTFDGAPTPGGNRYFIPEVTRALGDDEIFLDAGAHHGGVAKAFSEQTRGSFRQIIAIEPDPLNRAVFSRRLQADPRIVLHDCVLAEGAGAAPFHHGLGYASQISVTGQMRVTTQALDALGVSPSFVKLHLEGAELAVLKGARQTLLSNRPILAATVYHNADGIWKTPLWLMETLSDYQFLFRAHAWCGTGAVVYAVPKERIRS